MYFNTNCHEALAVTGLLDNRSLCKHIHNNHNCMGLTGFCVFHGGEAFAIRTGDHPPWRLRTLTQL